MHYFSGVYVDVFADHKILQNMFTQKKLNLRQRRWQELLKYYDMSILYHPGKAKVFVVCLSHMTMGSVFNLDEAKKDLENVVHRLAMLGVRLESSPDEGAIVYHNTESCLVVEVNSDQHLDLALMKLKESVFGKLNEFILFRGDCI